MAREITIAGSRYYIDVLKSNACQCEMPKRRGNAFCYDCYKALPWDMQRLLWQRIGQGFEEAYEEAVIYLSD
jgi:hypothetical protein